MKNSLLLVLITILFTAILGNAQSVTNTAESDIVYMLEEEKLARDVYLALYKCAMQIQLPVNKS